MWIMELLIKMMQHAYGIEIAQLMFALAGLIFNIWCVRQSMRNVTQLMTRHLNGLRLILATEDVQQEWLRLLLQVLMTLHGIIAVIYPPPGPDVPEPLEWGLRLTRIVIIQATILLTMKSWLDWRNRRTMVQAWLAEADRRKMEQTIAFPDRRLDTHD